MRLRLRDEEPGLIAVGQVVGVLTSEALTDELLVEMESSAARHKSASGAARRHS